MAADFQRASGQTGARNNLRRVFEVCHGVISVYESASLRIRIGKQCSNQQEMAKPIGHI